MFALAFAPVLCLLIASPAAAHFVWLEIPAAGRDGGGAGRLACLYFSETPEPGEPHLVARVAHTDAWVRTPNAADQPLAMRQSPANDTAALVAQCLASGAASLEATCDFGVYAHGDHGVLLYYYAKHLAGDWRSQADKLARAPRLRCDIVPEFAGNKLRVQVLYSGQPSAGSEVVILDPAGNEQTMTTDSQGFVSHEVRMPGRHAIRAAHIEKDQAGQRDGKTFDQVWHYATLTLDASPAEAASHAHASAADVLKRARDGRAIWEKFPGFSGEIQVTADGKSTSGSFTIDADGGMALRLPAGEVAEWVDEQLRSLVQHRMPVGEVSTGNVTWAEAESTHPLGRKIDLGDPSLESAYRIRDDVILEVNRSMGPQRFTISVLEISRNAENKYLPRSFTMAFYDAQTNQLKAVNAYRNDWQRIGPFDLPTLLLEVSTQNGRSVTRQIEFRNLKLLPVK